MQALFEYQLELGLPVRKISGDEAREMEPALSEFITAAVYCPMDHHIDNRLLVDALKTAYLKAGEHGLRPAAEAQAEDQAGVGRRVRSTPRIRVC
jgi:glycine/D-amino acid oxidase-like deaminating enzyme